MIVQRKVTHNEDTIKKIYYVLGLFSLYKTTAGSCLILNRELLYLFLQKSLYTVQKSVIDGNEFTQKLYVNNKLQRVSQAWSYQLNFLDLTQ